MRSLPFFCTGALLVFACSSASEKAAPDSFLQPGEEEAESFETSSLNERDRGFRENREEGSRPIKEDSEFKPSPPPPLFGHCDPDAEWLPKQAVAGLTDVRFSQLASVSFDGKVWLGEILSERSGFLEEAPIALSLGPSSSDATRYALAGVDGVRQQVLVPPGYQLGRNGGLGPRGLTITLVEPQRSGLATARRTTIDGVFGNFEPLAFRDIAEVAAQSDLVLTDPVLNDNTLLYTSTSPQGETFIQEAVLLEARWMPLPLLNLDERMGSLGSERVATGISEDGLTLFFWNEAEGQNFAVWRPRVDLPYLTPMPLPGAKGIRPNAACDTLYFVDDAGVAMEMYRVPPSRR